MHLEGNFLVFVKSCINQCLLQSHTRRRWLEVALAPQKWAIVELVKAVPTGTTILDMNPVPTIAIDQGMITDSERDIKIGTVRDLGATTVGRMSVAEKIEATKIVMLVAATNLLECPFVLYTNRALNVPRVTEHPRLVLKTTQSVAVSRVMIERKEIRQRRTHSQATKLMILKRRWLR